MSGFRNLEEASSQLEDMLEKVHVKAVTSSRTRFGGDVVLPGAPYSQACMAHTDWAVNEEHRSFLVISCATTDVTMDRAPMKILIDNCWVSSTLKAGELLVRNADVIHKGTPSIGSNPRCLPAIKIILQGALRRGYRPAKLFKMHQFNAIPLHLQEHFELLLQFEAGFSDSPTDGVSTSTILTNSKSEWAPMLRVSDMSK